MFSACAGGYPFTESCDSISRPQMSSLRALRTANQAPPSRAKCLGNEIINDKCNKYNKRTENNKCDKYNKYDKCNKCDKYNNVIKIINVINIINIINVTNVINDDMYNKWANPPKGDHVGGPCASSGFIRNPYKTCRFLNILIKSTSEV